MKDGDGNPDWDTFCEERDARREAIINLLTFLEIPFDPLTQTIEGEHLKNIFMDEEKCRQLISKLKNKVFW